MGSTQAEKDCRMLIERIDHALNQLWLFENLGQYAPLARYPTWIVDALVTVAGQHLERIDGGDEQLQSVLLDLYALPQYDSGEAQRALSEVRLKLLHVEREPASPNVPETPLIVRQ